MVDKYTMNLASVSMQNLEQVGGKNASLGEMISHLSAAGVRVPGGFATTADAFREFLSQSELDKKIYEQLQTLDSDNVIELAKVGQRIRHLIITTPFIPEFEQSIRTAYQDLANTLGTTDFSVAVRSSATAEDLPDASFAGQQETFLNITGIDAVLDAIKQVFASLYNDRAIAYRVHHGFEHHDVALSAGIQQMIRSDLATSGVMFTMDTESGFNEVVFITSAYGLGEMVVQGAVNPDEYYVHKPTLRQNKPAVIRRNLGSKAIKMTYAPSSEVGKTVQTSEVAHNERLLFSLNADEVHELARQALIIEEHYKRPMDIEWAKDGRDGKLYIVQARPETVKSRDNKQVLERYTLQAPGEILTEGRNIVLNAELIVQIQG